MVFPDVTVEKVREAYEEYLAGFNLSKPGSKKRAGSRSRPASKRRPKPKNG
jgi:hypothetical protein